ncbi:MAG: phage morphogenesis protein [Pseudomonadota bacterium]
MAQSKSLVWKGAAVTERMRKAQIAGVNATMEKCVVTSKNSHAWQYRNGALEGGIGIADYAAPDGQGVRGSWGVQDVKYARIHELGGTIKHPGGTPYFIEEDGMATFVRKDAPGAADLPKTQPHDIVIPARPYLRPSADLNYPDLPGAIRAAYDKSGGGDG